MRKITCLELNISEVCNYDCTYCIFHRNVEEKSIMPVQMAENITRRYLEYIGKEQGHIYLGAAEPLLNWDAIVAVSNIVRNHSNIWLSFMTNGSLINEEKLRYIKDNRISVGVSLDGKEETQKTNRPFVDKKGDSYRASLDFLQLADKIGYEVFSISATYNKKDFIDDALYVISLCEKYNIKEFDLDYDINSMALDELDDILNNLIYVYNIAKKKGLNVFGYWLIPIYNMRSAEEHKCYCENADGYNVCVSSSGKCKICGYDPHEYGIFESFEEFGNKQLMEKYTSYNSARKECKECSSFEYCCGQCIFIDQVNTINCELIGRIISRENEFD